MKLAVKDGGKSRGRLEQQNSAYLLILPSYLIYALFTLIPIVWTVVMSFTDYDLKKANFVGLKNYQNMFQDSLFLRSIWHTVQYTIMTIPVAMVLGLLLAILLNRAIPGRAFFRTVFYMPNVLSMVALSMAWLYLYDTNSGILNRLLRDMGLSPVPWLSDQGYAMISIAITSIWSSMGYNMVVFLSGLQSIPAHLYEAASIDGANAWQKFRKITLPMLAPTTFFIFVMACIRSFQVFGQVLILTNGGPLNSTTTIAHQIYRNGFEFYEMGYASAQAVVLLLIILVITVVNMRFGKGEESDIG